jgi:predicted ATP-grasp superfamily ATP-dependent carboligase
MMADALPVVVLKVARVPFHHGSLGITRTLGRLGVPVYTFHDSRWEAGAFSRFQARPLTHPLDGLPAAEIIQYLLDVGRRICGPAVLIPVDDMGSILVADHADALRDQFIFPEQPPGLARQLASKKELYFLCRRMGVSTPQTSFPRGLDELLSFAQTAAFPVVLKADDPSAVRTSSDTETVAIAQSESQLLAGYGRMEGRDRPNVLLQEYIPGGPEAVWMFNGYFDRRSECLLGLTGRKIRQFPPYTGATSLGICERNQTVEETTKRFMKAIGYRGIVDMGYRHDPRDGQYKVLDVNPRVGATFRLFEDTSGLDVVKALYLDLTGQPVEAGMAPEGRTWIVENYDLVSSVRYLRDGSLSPRRWLRSLRGVDETAWFATDDPAPFAMMCLSFIPRGILAYLRRRRLKRRTEVLAAEPLPCTPR